MYLYKYISIIFITNINNCIDILKKYIFITKMIFIHIVHLFSIILVDESTLSHSLISTSEYHSNKTYINI